MIDDIVNLDESYWRRLSTSVYLGASAKRYMGVVTSRRCNLVDRGILVGIIQCRDVKLGSKTYPEGSDVAVLAQWGAVPCLPARLVEPSVASYHFDLVKIEACQVHRLRFSIKDYNSSFVVCQTKERFDTLTLI